MTNKHDDERERKVRERAHALWEAEGQPAGRHEHHWHAAAEEIDAAPATPTASPAAKPRRATKKAPASPEPATAKAPAKPARAPQPVKPKAAKA